MNIISVANALKGVKVKDLDDEFQVEIVAQLNECLPDGVDITGETNGHGIREIIDKHLSPEQRLALMKINFIEDSPLIVRFYNNVDRASNLNTTKFEYDDAIKGNFISVFGFFVILVVLAMVAIYVATDHTRGDVPDSKVISVIDVVVDGLSTFDDDDDKH